MHEILVGYTPKSSAAKSKLPSRNANQSEHYLSNLLSPNIKSLLSRKAIRVKKHNVTEVVLSAAR